MRFIAGQPEATVFHHPAWAALLTETYGYRPLLLTQVDSRGEILAGAPFLEVHSRLTGHRSISLPFSDYCPPLARDGQALADFSDALVAWQTRGAVPLELRGTLPARPGIRQVPFGVRHLLPLQREAARLLARFDQPVRQRIRRASREGLTARIGAAQADLEPFYRLHWQTRQRLGVPVQPRRFFQILWHRIVESGLGFVVFVEKDAQPIAANLFLAWNGNLIGKYSASDSRFWRLGPNNLMLWTGIVWGCEAGYRAFDFGKSELENVGLRTFKSSWGSTELPLAYSWIGGAPSHANDGLAARLLATLIRRSPALLCRVTGELLYGHFP